MTRHSGILKSKMGFTLIEVLISMLILSVTSIILYQSWGGSMRAVRKSRIYSTVTLLLQRKVVEFEAQNKTKKIEELKDDESGDFGSSFPEYKWNIKLQPFNMPPIPLPKKANGQNQDQIAETITKIMQEYFKNAVREVTVSVIYTRGAGSKPLTYSVSTLFVDYSVEMPSGL